MIKKIYLACIVALFLSIQVFGQQHFRGIVVYSVSYPDSLLMTSKDLSSEITVSIYKKLVRTELLNSTHKSVIITDTEKGTSTLLLEIDGAKLAILTPAKKNNTVSTSQVFTKKETKSIAGLTCRKSLVYKGGKTLSAYYSIMYKAPNTSMAEGYETIQGLLLEYEQLVNGFVVKYKAKSVKVCTLKLTDFQVPRDFKIVTGEELSKIVSTK
jgi:hypothetical protein